jgi:hypothetical protein
LKQVSLQLDMTVAPYRHVIYEPTSLKYNVVTP